MNRPSSQAILAVILTAAAGATQALDVATLDRGIDPCRDFYGYANHRWIEAVPIPADRDRWGAFDQIAQRNEPVLVAALEQARTDLPRAGTTQRKAADFYASGMDLAAIEQAGTKPLEPMMERIARLDGPAALAPTLAFLHERGVDAGFAFAVSPDAKDSEHYLAQLLQAGLGLPDRDYYFLQDARSAQIRDAYVKHVARMFSLAGDDADAAGRNAAAAMAFETGLARASMSLVDRRDVDKTYNKRTVAQLTRDASGFAWREYFAASGAPELAELNVAQPEFMQAFARAAAERTPEEWRTYLRWQVLRAAANKLPEAYERADFDFYQGVLRGKASPPPRSRHVIEVIGGRYGTEPMGQALSGVFVERAFPPEAKARAESMIAGIKEALGVRLRTLEWMDEQTRRKALDKLAAMKVKAGYPDRWRDYSDAQVGAYPFVENWMRAKQFFRRRDLARIGKSVDRADWNMSPHIVNAQYNASANEITIPAGILQPPFFDATADDAANYGAIGAVIGHEITHGFDDRGRRFDARGNMTDWWTRADAERYLERARRVERQYGAYAGVDELHVNGKLTLGENISDLGGIKIAWLALQKALGEKPRESTEGFTPAQRFFLSYAQAWRSSYRPEMERLQLRTDAHSPPRFRVAGVVANMPEFAQAFSCDATRTLLSETERANIW